MHVRCMNCCYALFVTYGKQDMCTYIVRTVELYVYTINSVLPLRWGAFCSVRSIAVNVQDHECKQLPAWDCTTWHDRAGQCRNSLVPLLYSTINEFTWASVGVSRWGWKLGGWPAQEWRRVGGLIGTGGNSQHPRVSPGFHGNSSFLAQ
jgi:hypothetical protein